VSCDQVLCCRGARQCVLPLAVLQRIQALGPFLAVLFQNRTGRLALVDLWYDFEGGRNMNLIRSQQGRTLFDVEWNNGTR